METFFENTIGQCLLCGAIFIIAATVMHLFPPKKINHLYGYRTASAMQDQEHWDFAQKNGTKKMAISGLMLIAVSFAGKLYPIDDKYQTFVSIPITLGAALFIFLSTERAIQKQFPKN
ncbi:hypothetical protein GR160_15155 [Flavobacterium sp. Sd200]|uniref:SdpI family protein n=1 Tax=Flavobacterium sp. Sd200 TaxID=2692211 RepID=UPI001371255E|nr:SdpI family protein [Flavobacterium sp. Sd200]MXN92565.1 hypothetical protein [Flavobacterium sp. Sd200]